MGLICLFNFHAWNILSMTEICRVTLLDRMSERICVVHDKTLIYHSKEPLKSLMKTQSSVRIDEFEIYLIAMF